MAEKQHLNGAYYGPSIPPPQNYHRPGRSSGCDCCCGCCLLSLLFKLIISVAFTIGLIIFIFWLIFRPNKVKFHVTDAKLTEFNYSTTDNLLYYNLNLNFTIRNPNKRISIYYDKIEARALFTGQRFGSQFLTPFYQGHKNTSELSATFKGQQVVRLGSGELKEFNDDKANGVYDIDVKLHLKIRLKFRKVPIKIGKFKPKIKCGLKVPLSTNGNTTSTDVFKTTKCDFDF